MSPLFLLLVSTLRTVLGQEARDYTNRRCAIMLSSAGAVVTGRELCIRYEDVEEAFSLGRIKAGLRHPARQMTDQNIALLGTALQEASRILARRFWLSRWEVENVLPRLLTRPTDIGRFCTWPLLPPCPRERYRRIDATCNNLLDPSRGAPNLPFKRLLPPLYADRISEPRVARDGSPLPPPRLVSTRVHGDSRRRPHGHRISLMFPAWGQLVDHDLTLTAETKEPETRKELDCCSGGVGRHPNCYPLEVPKDDPFFRDKRQTCLNMARSLAGVRPGCTLGSRAQINLVTSYIDGNFIYGSNDRLAEVLRTSQRGLLKTQDVFPELGLKPILPPKTKQPDDGCMRPHPDIYCFLAGDNRVNEQLALGVLHTLAVREHNRIATKLSEINPHWDDETLYQEARHIMAALIQHITYNEFLPQLLGEKYVKQYTLQLQSEGYSEDYDPEVDATIPASFGTAAFRFGHSLLPDAMHKRSSTHKLIGERKLSEMIQQPFDMYKAGEIDAYILGMVNQVAQPMDHSITTEVTNHLFQEPARDFGRDLAAINVARAREHGIPGYMAYRKHCGLHLMESWQDMWSFLPNSTVAQYLRIYDHPDDVDLWSAGVSELSAPGSMLGPVFSCIIATTFRDLKKGDRFWYENKGFPSSFTHKQLKEIKKYTLSRFLCNTGDNIQTIQIKSMLLPDYDENPRVPCKSGEILDVNLIYWKEIPLNLNQETEEYPEDVHTPTNFYNGTEELYEADLEPPLPPIKGGYAEPSLHPDHLHLHSPSEYLLFGSDQSTLPNKSVYLEPPVAEPDADVIIPTKTPYQPDLISTLTLDLFDPEYTHKYEIHSERPDHYEKYTTNFYADSFVPTEKETYPNIGITESYNTEKNGYLDAHYIASNPYENEDISADESVVEFTTVNSYTKLPNKDFTEEKFSGYLYDKPSDGSITEKYGQHLNKKYNKFEIKVSTESYEKEKWAFNKFIDNLKPNSYENDKHTTTDVYFKDKFKLDFLQSSFIKEKNKNKGELSDISSDKYNENYSLKGNIKDYIINDKFSIDREKSSLKDIDGNVTSENDNLELFKHIISENLTDFLTVDNVNKSEDGENSQKELENIVLLNVSNVDVESDMITEHSVIDQIITHLFNGGRNNTGFVYNETYNMNSNTIQGGNHKIE